MIIRHDRNDVAYRCPADAYRAVTSFAEEGRTQGIVSLIHPRWVLTAAHGTTQLQLEHELRFADEVRTLRQIVPHPSWTQRPKRPESANLKRFTDVALLELDQPVETIEPLRLYPGTAEKGAVVTLIGNGATGTGLTGAQASDGVWRQATNRVEEVLHGTWLALRSDEPGHGVPLEGINGIGDSGCPALIMDNDQPSIAGIASWEDATHASVRGGYGAWKYFSRVSTCLPWIIQTIDAAA